jgi:hypothetical protein
MEASTSPAAGMLESTTSGICKEVILLGGVELGNCSGSRMTMFGFRERVLDDDVVEEVECLSRITVRIRCEWSHDWA